MPVMFRVANHRGYCDNSYKRAHGNTGIAAYDKSILAEPPRYIISIEVLKLHNERSRMRTITHTEDNITRIELININTQYLLEESLSFNELNDLF